MPLWWAPLGVLVFFALPLVVRLIAGGAGVARGWRSPIDLPVAGALCAVVAAATAWSAGAYLEGGPYTASDFAEYCEVVDATLEGRAHASGQRSLVVAGLLAPLVSALGVLDGFAVGAAAGVGVTAAGVYLWAHALAGRTAAVAGAVFVVACAPLAVFARTLTFYPSVVAASALASGATAMALRTRTTPWLALAAAAAAAAPLFDVRNVLWTAACAPLVLLAALVPPPGAPFHWLRALARVALVPLFLVTSWQIGSTTLPAMAAGTLEEQTRAFTNDVRRLATGAPPLPPCAGRGFKWGRFAVRELPVTVACLSRMSAGIPPAAAREANGGGRWARAVGPWMPLLGVGALLAAAGMSRERALRQLGVLVLLAPAVPFVITAATAWQDPNWRRIGAMFVPMPVLLGVAWAVVLEPERGSVLHRVLAPFQPATAAARRYTALAAVGAVAVVLGLPYTALSPTAPARGPWPADTEWATFTNGTWRDHPRQALCAARFEADARRGLPTLGRLGTLWWGAAPVRREVFPDDEAGGAALAPPLRAP